MRGFLIILTVAILAIYANALMTEEEYLNLTNHNDFETLSYSEYVEIFKDSPDHREQRKMGSVKEHLEEVIKFDQQYQAQKLAAGVNEDFLKMETKRNLPAIDKEFDWLKEKPSCFWNYKAKNQGYCGACYAFTATYALAKRYCIFGNKSIDLSPQDLLECTSGHGCNGGFTQNAFETLENEGVVTEECKPFYSGNRNPPFIDKCQPYCQDHRLSYTKYKAKKYSYVIKYNVDEIKEEIKNNGPVSTAMDAYEDLYSYKGGVYRHQPNARKLGGHGVTLVSWGYDSNYGIEYWVAANSWGADWGKYGFFKIPFGECDIGAYGMASKADV